MKTQKGNRDQDHADELRKAKRLAPVHKSGKERHALYSQVNDDEDNEPIIRRESTLDYFDDEEN
ncbi:MAG: hypothetical protein RRZ83_06325 [Alistipes sp.]